jgi:hypothetical protein
MRYEAGDCRQGMLAADKLFAVPVALAQVEQTEASEVSHGNTNAAWSVLDTEGHHGRAVLALNRIGQQSVKDFVVNVVVSGSVDVQEQRVPEQGHLPIVIGVVPAIEYTSWWGSSQQEPQVSSAMARIPIPSLEQDEDVTGLLYTASGAQS